MEYAEIIAGAITGAILYRVIKWAVVKRRTGSSPE